MVVEFSLHAAVMVARSLPYPTKFTASAKRLRKISQAKMPDKRNNMGEIRFVPYVLPFFYCNFAEHPF